MRHINELIIKNSQIESTNAGFDDGAGDRRIRQDSED
jgi:hypothetical protein